MRTLRIILAVCLVLCVGSCQRRPFGEPFSKVLLKIDVDLDIEHEQNPVTRPELMKVCLCDPVTGEVVFYDFLDAEGGYISPKPGDYDVIVYNYDSEFAKVRDERNFYTVNGSTDEVSDYVKNQLKPFLAARQQMHMQQRSDAELIVEQPDHLFAGTVKGVHIPQVYEEEVLDMTVGVDVSTVVETWYVKLSNVKGVENISEIKSLMTGMSESTLLHNRQDSENPVTILFDMKAGKDGRSLVGMFRIYGKNPLYDSLLDIDLEITDTGGEEEYFNFDVTDQFDNNKDHWIIIDEEIVVDKPVGGGFLPTVDEWENIETDIII